MRLLKRLLSDQKVQSKYIEAGTSFDEAVSYLYMGECIGFKTRLRRWGSWEQEYAHRGFRTVSIDDFVERGGYCQNIDDLFGVKREQDENPIYHAQIYKEIFLGKIPPVIDFEKLERGESQIGTYVLPSTKQVD